MTKISYGSYDGGFYFEANGHAVSEELFGGYGCDESDSKAVCAAISMLVLAARERLSELESEGGTYRLSSEVEEGYACFDVMPRECAAECVEEIFRTLMAGFGLLEENYPELIACC